MKRMPMLSSKAQRDGKDDRRADTSEVAGYIDDLLGSLKTIALSRQLERLAHLLELARIEARDVARLQ